MSSSGNASGAGAGSSSSSSSSSSTASVSSQNTTKTITEEDKKARELVEQFDKLLQWHKKRNEELKKKEDSYDNLIITVGIAKHIKNRLQLGFMMDMIMRENLFDLDTEASSTIIIHFDEEFNKPRQHTQTSKKEANIGELYTMYQNSPPLDKDNYPVNYVGNLEPYYDFYDFENFFENFPKELNELVDERNKFIWVNGFCFQLFVPFNLVSYYTTDYPIGNYLRMKNKKMLLEAGKDCTPIQGSTYEALQKMINEYKFKKIIIYNAAYWEARDAVRGKNGQITGMSSFHKNKYFEGMCELLNIVKDSDAEKYIFDTEFKYLKDANVYHHNKKRNIRSFKNSGYPRYPVIGTLYPLNETTKFVGGKQIRKTQKLRKNKKRTYKNRL